MSIKRFQDAISIISSKQASTAELHAIQHDINHIIHNNLYNFMLPHKVKEVIDSLTPLFVKMKELNPLPHRVEKKRTELLQQGREIISKLKPYLNALYSKDEYSEVYTLQYKRLLAEYLKCKKDLEVEMAVSLLKKGKELKKECEMYIEGIRHNAFDGMLLELKKYITENLQ